MIISQTQFELKKQEFIKDLLKMGITPNSYELSQRLNAFFEVQVPGVPYFVVARQSGHGISIAKNYISMYEALETDFEVAYKASQENNQKLLEIEENYNIESEQLQQKLKKLRLRLTSLEEAISNKGFCGSFNEVFHHFYQVEFDGVPERNIPNTTCFVNLSEHQCELEQRLSTVQKEDLTTAAITFQTLTSVSSTSSEGELETVLKDTINESSEWTFQTSNSDSHTSKINVTLNQEATANTLKFKFYSHVPLKVSLTLFDSEDNSELLYELTDDQILSWHFDSRSIKRFELTITKTEADGITENGAYEFYYLFKNISLSTEYYLSEGQYVTKPFTFQKIPSNLMLMSEDYTFPKTHLYYYIALDNGSNVLNWERIESNQDFQFDILEEKKYRIHSLSEGYDDQNYVDQQLYRIYNLPSRYVEESIKLVGGYQKWKWQVIDLSKSSYREGLDVYQLDLDEILSSESVPTPNTYFMGCDHLEWVLPTQSLVICDQYLMMDQDQTINQKVLTLPDGTDYQARFFLNGTEIKSVQNRLNFRLKKGKNRIQLLYYLPTQEDEASMVKLTHNLNFKECATMIYALPPMKRVDYYTLNHLQPQQDVFQYYAIEDSVMYVKYNPSILSKQGMQDQVFDYSGSPYFVSLQQVRKETAHLLLQSGTSEQLQVRLMAILKTDSNSLSPKIKSFRFIAH